MNRSLALLVSGFFAPGLIGSLSEAAGSSPENRPETVQVQKHPDLERCIAPIPAYVFRCADGAVEGPFWVVREGECKIIPACFAHGGPLQLVGPRIVGAGEECNASLPPEYATLCADDLTCVLDSARLGSSGICMTSGQLGDRCDSNRYEIRWVQCEEGLQCKAWSIPFEIGAVPVMTCQQ